MTGVFLQVRIDSSRLPGKALLPLSGKTVIEHAMLSLKKIDAGMYALLTDQASTRLLSPLAKKCGFILFAGDKLDVLKRYADAAEYFNVDTIVRATGDNPLVSGVLADRITKIHCADQADFSCYTSLPLGTGVEVVKAESLLYAARNAKDPFEREHVNPYLYRREGQFFINRVPAPEESRFPQGRVTLDTEDDYHYLQLLFSKLYKGSPLELDVIIPWMRIHARKAVSVTGE